MVVVFFKPQNSSNFQYLAVFLNGLLYLTKNWCGMDLGKAEI